VGRSLKIGGYGHKSSTDGTDLSKTIGWANQNIGRVKGSKK